MTTPEIEELKSLVEQKYGKILATTTDFEEFSLYLEKKTCGTISPSTLKRLYGYVSDNHKPRMVTLDVLSQYIGHRNYMEFTHWLKTSTKYNSSFFKANQLVSSDLQEGALVSVGWSPNRLLQLRYLGDSTYEIEKSENSKLHQEILFEDFRLAFDIYFRFVPGCFIKEQPLFLPYIERGGERTASFVAGRNGGLTVISINEK